MSTALSHLYPERGEMLTGAAGGYDYAELLKEQFEPNQKRSLMMDRPLEKIITLVNQYVGNQIDAAAMPPEDRQALKDHLKAAEDILLRNGNARLQEMIGQITGAVLRRFE